MAAIISNPWPIGPPACASSGKLLARSRRSGLRFSPKTIGRLQPAVPRLNHGLRARLLRRLQTLAPHSRPFPPLRARPIQRSLSCRVAEFAEIFSRWESQILAKRRRKSPVARRSRQSHERSEGIACRRGVLACRHAFCRGEWLVTSDRLTCGDRCDSRSDGSGELSGRRAKTCPTGQDLRRATPPLSRREGHLATDHLLLRAVKWTKDGGL